MTALVGDRDLAAEVVAGRPFLTTLRALRFVALYPIRFAREARVSATDPESRAFIASLLLPRLRPMTAVIAGVCPAGLPAGAPELRPGRRQRGHAARRRRSRSSRSKAGASGDSDGDSDSRSLEPGPAGPSRRGRSA